MEQKTYKLTGLLIIFISLILSFIGGIALGVFSAITGNGNQAAAVNDISQLSEMMGQPSILVSIISGVLSLVVLILYIVGVAKLRRENKRFKLAFVMMILLIVLTIITVIAVSVYAAIGFKNMESFDPNSFFITLIIPLACALILMIIGVIYEWGLLSGCRLVAEDCGDSAFAKKVRGTWRLYLISFIIGLVALVLTGLFLYLVIGRMTLTDYLALQNITSIADLSQFAILLIPLAVLIVSMIISIVAGILMMVRFLQTYIKFNGKSPAYVPEIEVSDEIDQPFDGGVI